MAWNKYLRINKITIPTIPKTPVIKEVIILTGK